MILFMWWDLPSFLEFSYKSTYMPGCNLTDEVLYTIAIPLSNEPESKSDDTYPWSEILSDEILYEIAVQLSEEEQEDKMDTSESPSNLLQLPKHGHTTRTPTLKTLLGHCRDTFVLNLLDTEL